MVLERSVNHVAGHIAQATEDFIETKAGKLFLSLMIVGPLTFLPTLWEALTAENIDSLRTLTWPLLTVVNTSILVAVCHNGDWRLRLSIFMWICIMAAMSIITIVR